MTVMIFGGSDDAHVKVVSDKIIRHGAHLIYLDYNSSSPFSLIMTQNGHMKLFMDSKIVPSIDIAWNRVKFFLEFVSEPEQRDEYIRRSEWGGAYRTIFELYDGKIVNSPASQHKCESKIYQQKVASDVGFFVPPTLLTNSKVEAFEFIEEQHEIICKAVGRGQLPVHSTLPPPHAFLTCQATADDVHSIPDEDFSKSVSFLQKMIPKKHELRIAWVAGRSFAFAINSQDFEGSKVDWRPMTSKLDRQLVPLPMEVERKLSDFMSAMDLWHGHFDLIVDPDDQIWFLECNPNGQWLGFDEIAGGIISDRYAEALCEADVASVPETAAAADRA